MKHNFKLFLNSFPFVNKERNAVSAFMWKQYRNSQLEWWHCSVCGHAVQLHSSDHKVGCYKDGCKDGCKDNRRVHLCKGKVVVKDIL